MFMENKLRFEEVFLSEIGRGIGERAPMIMENELRFKKIYRTFTPQKQK